MTSEAAIELAAVAGLVLAVYWLALAALAAVFDELLADE